MLLQQVWQQALRRMWQRALSGALSVSLKRVLLLFMR